jgi:cell envelope-related function transcriptional attenuator common domain
MKTKKKMSGKKKLTISAITFFSLIIVLIVIIVVFAFSKVNKINVVTDDPMPTVADNAIPTEPEDSKGPDSSKAEIAQADKNINACNLPVKSSKDVFNILLIGIDTRKNNGVGRSDSMILVSIDKKNKKITMTSFMRDMYVQIPGHTNSRLNSAFAVGGADLLTDTIEQNFKVKIDRYAYINFFSFIDIVNSVGGVDLEVAQKDIPVINEYIMELNLLTGKPATKDYLTKPGMLHLNGKQALGYARNRYTGNSDFERTARQRRVMEQIFIKAKKLNVVQMNKLLDRVLPEVTTNMPKGDILGEIVKAPAYLKYDLEQFRVPMDNTHKGLRIRGMAVMSVDFTTNVTELQKRLYGAQ